MKSFFKFSSMLLVAALFITSCSEDPETPVPPVEEVPTPNKTITELRALVTGDVAVEVPADFVFKGIVVSNQGVSNNFYRALYIQDGDVAIKLSCDKDGTKFYETIEMGREVIVKASGLYVAKSYDTYLLGSGPDDKYKVTLIPEDQLKTALYVGDAATVTPKEINDISTLTTDMVGTFVKVNDVQVVEADRNKNLGGDGSQGYTTLTFTTIDNKTVKISNNNYANFGDQVVPDGSGSISGVLSTFGSDFQIMNTAIEDFNLTGERFVVEGGGSNEGINEGDNSVSGASDLFISEYVEGSSSNKYLEIFNATGAEVDLSGYSIKVASNGAMFADKSHVPLTGMLPNGANLVIANADAALTLPDGKTASTAFSTATYFNGDDAVGLFKGETLIDVIGVEGERPSSGGWEVNGVANATKDHTLVRKATAKNPVTTWAPTEWEVKDKDVVTNIGSHTYTPGS